MDSNRWIITITIVVVAVTMACAYAVLQEDDRASDECTVRLYVCHGSDPAGDLQGSVLGTYTVGRHTVFTYTAEAEEDSGFRGWYIGGEQASRTLHLNLIIKDDADVVALYDPSVYTVSLLTDLGEGADPSVILSRTSLYGDQIQCTAPDVDGYKFEGWYDKDGTAFSSSAYISFMVTGDTVLYAVYGNAKHTLTVLTEVDGYVTGISSETVFDYDEVRRTAVRTPGAWFDGWYADGRLLTSSAVVCLDVDRDTEVTAVYHTMARGPEVKTVAFDWHYWTHDAGDSFRSEHTDSLELHIPVRSYTAGVLSGADRDDFGRFVTPDDPIVLEAAEHLSSTIAKGDLGESDALDYVLKFVQSIQYELDRDSRGEEEYAKYPVETLFDGAGDCEDTAILLVSLYAAMGYDSVLIETMDLFRGHMSVGVSSDSVSGDCYVIDGIRYWCCESAVDFGDGWSDCYNVGEFHASGSFEKAYRRDPAGDWIATQDGRIERGSSGNSYAMSAEAGL